MQRHCRAPWSGRRRVTRLDPLPPGGDVTGDYRFIGEAGPVDLAGLFGDRVEFHEHRREILERHIGAGPGIVQTPVRIFLDRDGRFFVGHLP